MPISSSAPLLAAALNRAQLRAWSALSDPVPGTMLSVMEAAARAAAAVDSAHDGDDSNHTLGLALDAAVNAAVAAVGGHAGVFPCRTSFAAVNHGVQTALAWKLHVTLERVGTTMHAPGLDFIGPHNATDGQAAPVDPRLTQHQRLVSVDGWRVVRLTDPNHAELSACVGH